MTVQFTWRDINLRAFPDANHRVAAYPPGADIADCGIGCVAVKTDGGMALIGSSADAVLADGSDIFLDGAGGDAPVLLVPASTSIKASWWIPVNRVASQSAFLKINPYGSGKRVRLQLEAWPGARDDLQIRVFAAFG